jgi:hypothetical protein
MVDVGVAWGVSGSGWLQCGQAVMVGTSSYAAVKSLLIIRARASAVNALLLDSAGSAG